MVEILREALQKIADGTEVTLHTGQVVLMDCDDAGAIAREALAHASPTDRVTEALREARQALEYSINALDGVIAHDEEDMGKDGGSAACQATIRINRRALAKIDAARAALREGSSNG